MVSLPTYTIVGKYTSPMNPTGKQDLYMIYSVKWFLTGVIIHWQAVLGVGGGSNCLWRGTMQVIQFVTFWFLKWRSRFQPWKGHLWVQTRSLWRTWQGMVSSRVIVGHFPNLNSANGEWTMRRSKWCLSRHLGFWFHLPYDFEDSGAL